MPDILIVEDNDKERDRLQRLCASAGYSVRACASVVDAEAVLAVASFRLAMLDIGLSDRSGTHLFGRIRRAGTIPHVIIYTGNPSVHLKQRMLDEGAAAYLVKGSPQSHNDELLVKIRSCIGDPKPDTVETIPLDQFVARYIPESSRGLFLSADNTIPCCVGCGATTYVVSFAQQLQLPPEVKGVVVCLQCGRALDQEVK